MTDNTTDTSSVDYNILLNLLQNLVTQPDKLEITRRIDEQGVLLSVLVDEVDMGIVIGRGGSMASAVKTLMRAVGKANKMNIRVQFLEPDGTIRYNRPQRENNDNPDSYDRNTSSFRTDISSEQKAEAVKSLDADLEEFVIN
jgi:hypothetical protein